MPGLIISSLTFGPGEKVEYTTPYGTAGSGTGSSDGISLLTPQDLEDALHVWIDLNHNGIRDEGEIFEIPAPH